MNSKTKTILISIVLLFSNVNSFSQGCSDAGVCTAGPSHFLQSDSLKAANKESSSIGLNFSFAMGEQGVSVLQIIPEINIGIVKNLSLQAKVPFMMISGNLANVSGVGDVLSGLSYRLHQNEVSGFSVYGGVKIPLSESNTKENKKSLPMPYQVGLGTFDVLGAITYNYKNWQVNVGYQQVLDNGNKNRFTHELWAENTDAQKYFESKAFERGNDASFKLERYFKIRKGTFAPGILAIYRLNEDRALDSNNVRQELKGSDGLTLNIIGNANIEIGKKSSLKFQLGFPVIIRDVRADGLTRSLVLNVGFAYLL